MINKYALEFAASTAAGSPTERAKSPRYWTAKRRSFIAGANFAEQYFSTEVKSLEEQRDKLREELESIRSLFFDTRSLTPERLLSIVAVSLGMKVEDYSSKRRCETNCELRMVADILLVKCFGKGFATCVRMGELFNRDHTSISNMRKTRANLMKSKDSQLTTKLKTAEFSLDAFLHSNWQKTMTG
jgi:hypothetical protein